MRVEWVERGSVLRFRVETVEDLDIVGELAQGPLRGAHELLELLEGSPFEPVAGRQVGTVKWRWRSDADHTRTAFVLVGLEWDIRNQPAVGRPRSDLDVRMTQATQAVGQGLHQMLGLLVAEREVQLARAAAGVSAV